MGNAPPAGALATRAPDRTAGAKRNAMTGGGALPLLVLVAILHASGKQQQCSESARSREHPILWDDVSHDALETLLHPMSVDTFLNEYWDTKWLHIPRGCTQPSPPPLASVIILDR